MKERYRVELYNSIRGGRSVGNGYCVVDKGADGRLSNVLYKFEGPTAEMEARIRAAQLNA